MRDFRSNFNSNYSVPVVETTNSTSNSLNPVSKTAVSTSFPMVTKAYGAPKLVGPIIIPTTDTAVDTYIPTLDKLHEK